MLWWLIGFTISSGAFASVMEERATMLFALYGWTCIILLVRVDHGLVFTRYGTITLEFEKTVSGPLVVNAIWTMLRIAQETLLLT